mgnify:CR=1 FL=1
MLFFMKKENNNKITMEKLEIPLYFNSCGKIFEDRLIFASAYKENIFDVSDIGKVSMRKKLGFKSVLSLLLPFGLIGILYLERDLDFIVQATTVVLTLIFFIVAFVNTEMKYYIILQLKSTKNVKIRISKNNKKDAGKFVEKAQSLIENTEMHQPVNA